MPEDRKAFVALLTSAPKPIQRRLQDLLGSVVFKSEYRVAVPAKSTSAGSAGQWAMDASYLYVCYADGAWRRVAVGTF